MIKNRPEFRQKVCPVFVPCPITHEILIKTHFIVNLYKRFGIGGTGTLSALFCKKDLFC